MAVWVVVGMLSVAAVSVAVASRRHSAEVEPTVRAFTEFREALSQQVVGLQVDTTTTRSHADARSEPRPAERDHQG